MKTLVLSLIAALLLPTCLAAQSEPKAPQPRGVARPEGTSRLPSGDRAISGQVYVGEAAPGFELTSFEGKPFKLSSLAGDRVLLYFADRRETLSRYRLIADSLGILGVRLIGIARDSPRSLRSLADRDSLSFTLLSDPTGQVSAVYGSYDYATSSIRPAYVLVGRTGLVRMALLGQSLPASDVLQITRYALSGL